MARYVLVHGAWQGSWGYTEVARQLREKGHEVHVPALTGIGEREHLASPAITLGTHIADVVGLIESRDLEDVILCGHSYGGMVITGAASQVARRIRTLFYLDAFLPQDGQALWDITDEGAHRHYIEGQKDMPGLVAPFSGVIERPFNGKARRLSRQPLLTLTEPVRLSGEERTIPNRTYIYATRNAPTSFTRFYEQLRHDPAWKVETVPTGHVVMQDDPDLLVRLLLEEADR